MPFNFLFYGQSYSSVYVDTNGLLSFVGPPGFAPHRNVALTDVAAPPGIVAPFWTDLAS